MKYLIGLFLLLLIPSFVFADQCITYQKEWQNVNGIDQLSSQKRIVRFEYFKTKSEAEIFVKLNGGEIFTEQTGGYYVFLNAPKDYFSCKSIEEE